MTTDAKIPHVGVAVLIQRGHHVLVGQRIGSFCPGLLSSFQLTMKEHGNCLVGIWNSKSHGKNAQDESSKKKLDSVQPTYLSLL
jgi:hypothetical protein